MSKLFENQYRILDCSGSVQVNNDIYTFHNRKNAIKFFSKQNVYRLLHKYSLESYINRGKLVGLSGKLRFNGGYCDISKRLMFLYRTFTFYLRRNKRSSNYTLCIDLGSHFRNSFACYFDVNEFDLLSDIESKLSLCDTKYIFNVSFFDDGSLLNMSFNNVYGIEDMAANYGCAKEMAKNLLEGDMFILDDFICRVLKLYNEQNNMCSLKYKNRFDLRVCSFCGNRADVFIVNKERVCADCLRLAYMNVSRISQEELI